MGRTLYNWFPMRDALVEAVFADRVATVADLTERALAMDDAWDGFVVFLTGVCELQGADLGYNDLAARTAPVDGDRGYGLMLEILDRAQRYGELRPDITLADMAFVLWGVAATIRATHKVAPRAWRRHLTLTLDGLRATTAHPLQTPPMSTQQTRAALRKC
ncbi:SbtR family transcriptional regulator [Nonomuraea glycinis]|uniref:SbtR family transcriptional regulator n=1 Tax=Nonomuraea glycinis TaxID=2047744 RepID=UPI002E0E8850|nr:hypothetical protein OHA68_05135 [Nonomuraea glycinis]